MFRFNMYTNEDIEKYMLAATSFKVEEKLNEVALIISNPSQKYDIARKIKIQWDIRSSILKKVDNVDELNSWRGKTFLVASKPDTIDSATSSAANNYPKKGGRKKLRLSDTPCTKTENNLLDPLLSHLECAAAEEGVDPHFLLEKLVLRAHQKWKKPRIEEKTVEETEETEKSLNDGKYDVPAVDAACALVYNVNLSIQQYQKLRLYLIEFGI